MSLHTLYSTLHTSHSILHTLHFPLHTLHFTLDTPGSTLYALHFTLYTLPFSLYTLRSTLYTLHCALPPQQSLSTPYCNNPQPAGSSKPKPSAAPLELLSWLCNPSPPLPQYHFSSPCKLSCSEPQRTLLSVELRSASIFLHFPPAFKNFSVVFFLPFSCQSSIFLHFPPVFNDFPSFSLVFSTTRRRLARERKRCFSSRSEDGSRKR